MHPEHCYKLHAEAIRGCNLDQIAAITILAHAPATGGVTHVGTHVCIKKLN